MPKSTKEIVIGFVPVLLIFLIFIGYNILPLLLIAALAGGTFLVLQMRGGLAVGAAQERKRKKMVRSN